MSHKIGGEDFDNLEAIDIKEMFEDEALGEDDIIQIISNPAQLEISENYNESGEGHVIVIAKVSKFVVSWKIIFLKLILIVNEL